MKLKVSLQTYVMLWKRDRERERDGGRVYVYCTQETILVDKSINLPIMYKYL